MACLGRVEFSSYCLSFPTWPLFSWYKRFFFFLTTNVSQASLHPRISLSFLIFCLKIFQSNIPYSIIPISFKSSVTSSCRLGFFLRAPKLVSGFSLLPCYHSCGACWPIFFLIYEKFFDSRIIERNINIFFCNSLHSDRIL